MPCLENLAGHRIKSNPRNSFASLKAIWRRRPPRQPPCQAAALVLPPDYEMRGDRRPTRLRDDADASVATWFTWAERTTPGPTICAGGGGGWIRTSVGEANGFTVRPL